MGAVEMQVLHLVDAPESGLDGGQVVTLQMAK
jgi:hypothetical protein